MKKLTTIDLLALPSLETPPAGCVGFGAKSDGLYQKVGTVETKLSIEGHTHTISNVSGLQSALDGKANVSHTHAYLPLSGGTMTNTNLVTNLNADLLDGIDSSRITYGTSNITAVTQQDDITTAYRAGFYAGYNGIGYPTQGDSSVLIIPYKNAKASYRYGVRIGGWSEIYHQLATADGTGTWYKIWSERNLINPVTGTGTANYLPKFTGASSIDNSVIYESNGNIGIGTTTPENSESWEQVLDVRGIAHAKSIVTTTNVHTGVWSHNSGFYGAPAGGIIGTKSNHPLSLITNGAFKVIISNIGNVGIGTTTPSQKLHVIGNAIVSGTVTAPTFSGNLSGNASTASSVGGLTGIGTATPLMDGTAAVGTSTLAARQDHRHPTDTSRAATNQTMYIGTTAVAINRASATLNLTGIGSLAMGGALTGATTIAASVSVTTPKVIFSAAGWSVEQSGTELVFKYNGITKQRLLNDGSIVAVGELTAFGSAT